MALEIPTQAIPNQTLQANVNGQATAFHIYQTDYGLFMDIYLNSTLIISGIICQNLNRIIRSTYLGYAGDFVWVDIQNADDPIYTGLGTRFFLVYIDPDQLPTVLAGGED